MKTFPIVSTLFVALALSGHVDAATTPTTASPGAASAAAAEPDAAVLASLTQAVRDGRFGTAFKRGVRASPASPARDRVLALEDDIVGDVFARIIARRFDRAEATAIAAFYASPEGRALTEAQLAADGSSLDPEQRKAIAAFFSSPAGRKFNTVVDDAAVREELQVSLAFIAGPAAK
jgi:hypothetical protein